METQATADEPVIDPVEADAQPEGSSPNEPPAANLGDQLQAVDALLNGEPLEIDENGQQAQPEAADEPEADEPEPEKAEAEEPEEDEPEAEPEGSLDEPPAEAEIDYEREIPMPDGREPVKLGDLKDSYVNMSRQQEELIQRKNAINQESSDAMVLIRYAGEIPEPVRQAALSQHNKAREQAFERMLELNPDMKTEAGFTAARQELVELGREYNKTEAEIASVMDPDLVNMMRDYISLRKTVREGQQQMKKAQKKSARGRSPGRQTPQRDAAGRFERALNSGNQQAALEAINELL